MIDVSIFLPFCSVMVVVRSFGKHLPTILLLSHAASVMIGNSNNKIFFIWVPLLMLCELYQKQSGFTNCANPNLSVRCPS